MEISDELKNKAIANGLCEQWTNEWSNEETLDSLCEKYVKGIDFCIDNDYPSCQYMKEHFDGVMQKHGIYVSDMFKLRDIKKLIINGVSIGEVTYDKFNVGRIYLRHSSFLKLSVKDCAKVFISTYDSVNLDVTDCDIDAKLYISNHGGTIKYDKNNKNIIVR